MLREPGCGHQTHEMRCYGRIGQAWGLTLLCGNRRPIPSNVDRSLRRWIRLAINCFLLMYSTPIGGGRSGRNTCKDWPKLIGTSLPWLVTSLMIRFFRDPLAPLTDQRGQESFPIAITSEKDSLANCHAGRRMRVGPSG